MKHDEHTISVRAQLGARISDLRKSQHISQQSFALMIGMDRTYLASVEKGRRNIAIDNISKIASGLGVTLGELMEGIKLPEDKGDYTYYVAKLED